MPVHDNKPVLEHIRSDVAAEFRQHRKDGHSHPRSQRLECHSLAIDLDSSISTGNFVIQLVYHRIEAKGRRYARIEITFIVM